MAFFGELASGPIMEDLYLVAQDPEPFCWCCYISSLFSHCSQEWITWSVLICEDLEKQFALAAHRGLSTETMLGLPHRAMAKGQPWCC